MIGFSANVTGATGFSYRYKMSLLSPHVNFSSKWLLDLNIEAKTIKWAEENRGENLHELGGGKDFLDTKGTHHKSKSDQLNQ